MKDNRDEVVYSDRLKGKWGVVEAFSCMLSGYSFYYNVVKSKPAVIDTNAEIFYTVMTIMGVLGLAGIGYTQKLRARVRNDPSLRSKYFEVKKPGGSIVLVKENWTPLKKWAVLFLIGAAIMAAFIATVVLLK